MVLPRGRLAQLVRKAAALYRKAHLTAEEARYVHRRARALAGIRGGDLWDFIADLVVGGSCQEDPPTSQWFWRVLYGSSVR